MNVIYGRVKQALRVEETATRKQRPLSAKEVKEKARDEARGWSLRGLRREIWEERQFAAIEKEAKKWARAERLRCYIARIEEMGDDYEVEQWLEMAKQLVDDLGPISSETFSMLVDLPKYEEVERIANSRRNPYC